MKTVRSLDWLDEGVLRILDQRKLPHEVVAIDCTTAEEVAYCIKEMVTRGALSIGVAAGYALVLVCRHTTRTDAAGLRSELNAAAEHLRHSRPTAVNLSLSIDRLLDRLADPALDSVSALTAAALSTARAIDQENTDLNYRICLHGAVLVPEKATIVHHCNTGSLGGVQYGTALGIIWAAHDQGKDIFVLVDETRPLLQGGRLTSWELLQYGIPFQVIVDGASGFYMHTMGVDLCLVGADRIAANGDTANKIGTFNLALAAHAHRVPFYVAAPTTTIDLATPCGEEIPIEERPSAEITHAGPWQITPGGTPVGNPAFDVTPAQYITAIITENGVAYPPFDASLAAMMAA